MMKMMKTMENAWLLAVLFASLRLTLLTFFFSCSFLCFLGVYDLWNWHWLGRWGWFIFHQGPWLVLIRRTINHFASIVVIRIGCEVW